MGESTQPIEIPVHATLAIDPRDVGIIAAWDIEQLRHLVFDIRESSAEIMLGKGIRAVVRFITPTPFDLKAAQLGEEPLASMHVSPLPDEPDVQVVARWRYRVASLSEVLVVRRFLPALQAWQPAQLIERVRASSGWVLGVCHPAHAISVATQAERAGLTASIEPFTPPDDQSPEQFGASWGCEVPPMWWPR